MKKVLRQKLIKDLSEVRKELQKYSFSQKFSEDLNLFPDSLQQNPPTPKSDPNLYSIVYNQISTKGDLYRSMGYWSCGNLLEFTLEQRLVICTALIEKSKILGIKPKSLWIDVIKKPDEYEEWAEEIFGNIHSNPMEKVLVS